MAVGVKRHSCWSQWREPRKARRVKFVGSELHSGTAAAAVPASPVLSSIEVAAGRAGGWLLSVGRLFCWALPRTPLTTAHRPLLTPAPRPASPRPGPPAPAPGTLPAAPRLRPSPAHYLYYLRGDPKGRAPGDQHRIAANAHLTAPWPMGLGWGVSGGNLCATSGIGR